MGKIVAAVVALVAVAGIIVWVAGDWTDSPGSSTTASIPADERTALPSIEGETYDGSAWTSDEIDGPTVIHIFASWCPTCRREAPKIADLMESHPDLDWVFVAVENREHDAMGHLDEFGWGEPLLLNDPNRSIQAALGLRGQPHSIFIDDAGRVAYVHQGGTRPESYEATVEAIS